MPRASTTSSRLALSCPTLLPFTGSVPVSLFCDQDGVPQRCQCQIDPAVSLTGVLITGAAASDGSVTASLWLTGNVAGDSMHVVVSGVPGPIDLYGRTWDGGYEFHGTSCVPGGCCVRADMWIAPARVDGVPGQVAGALSLVRSGCAASCADDFGVNVPYAAL